MQLMIATGEPTRLRWTDARYMALVESGVIPEGTGYELVEGEVLEVMPQGNRHFQTFRLLQQAFAVLGGFSHGLVSTPTIRVSEFTVVDPEFAVVRQQGTDHLPTASETVWIIEISDSSLRYDMEIKHRLYGLAGIPRYWVVDIPGMCVHEFSEPNEEGYARHEVFNGMISIPEFVGTIDVQTLFPSEAR